MKDNRLKFDIQMFSGGSYDYVCYKIEEQCVGRMHDVELDDLMKDIANLMHDLEWWQSADSSEETYRETVNKFKNKWFETSRQERLKGYIDEKIDRTKSTLYNLLGWEE